MSEPAGTVDGVLFNVSFAGKGARGLPGPMAGGPSGALSQGLIPRGGLAGPPEREPHVETGPVDMAPQHPAESILKTNISCKQDISFCQRDQNGLEVFLHTLSLACVCLSLWLYLFISVHRQEEMAAGETQLYAKVSNKLKVRGPSSLLEPLLGMGFPVHTA